MFRMTPPTVPPILLHSQATERESADITFAAGASDTIDVSWSASAFNAPDFLTSGGYLVWSLPTALDGRFGADTEETALLLELNVLTPMATRTATSLFLGVISEDVDSATIDGVGYSFDTLAGNNYQSGLWYVIDGVMTRTVGSQTSTTARGFTLCLQRTAAGTRWWASNRYSLLSSTGTATIEPQPTAMAATAFTGRPRIVLGATRTDASPVVGGSVTANVRCRIHPYYFAPWTA